AIGAAGGIGGTYGVMPQLFLKMDELFRAGKVVDAQPIQHEVNDIIAGMCSTKANMYAVAKEIVRINSGLTLGGVRAPLMGLLEEDLPKVQAVAAKIRAAIEKFC
ncbi:MAG: N-acetylneuraminate lyase, partial [Clostridiales bacterium]|nr:N-acetylneuraminate lyase [Clostridiales bacterium]